MTRTLPSTTDSQHPPPQLEHREHYIPANVQKSSGNILSHNIGQHKSHPRYLDKHMPSVLRPHPQEDGARSSIYRLRLARGPREERRKNQKRKRKFRFCRTKRIGEHDLRHTSVTATSTANAHRFKHFHAGFLRPKISFPGIWLHIRIHINNNIDNKTYCSIIYSVGFLHANLVYEK